MITSDINIGVVVVFANPRQRGATVVDNLGIENSAIILDPFQIGETIALLAEFKLSINDYLQELVYSPVRSLAEIIEFNIKHPDLVSMHYDFQMNNSMERPLLPQALQLITPLFKSNMT